MKKKNGAAARDPILRSIREVIGLEARTLGRVRDAVNPAYSRAARRMARCRGKVIVTGVGKSGLIAQKIAATLSSTGTPAFYLHPSEAMHGDLGMVDHKDLVLAVGKSGESSELTALLPALKRLGVLLIALTASEDSTLARAADIVLRTPVEREACPLNLSPTCSTTAALAVGDALAVALMRLRRFRKEHFAALHPGGQLGKRLTLLVDDLMRRGADLPTVRPSAPAGELLLEMTRKHAGAACVVDGRGRLKGLVTDYDIRRNLGEGRDPRSLPARLIMNPKPSVIRAGSLAVEAVELMGNRRNPFSVLPVVDGRGRAVGLLQIHDLRAQGL
ncbi:MAG: KpsF/GutQ family sugar-phosphate isomerase [Elusimicrobiota bacterium]